MSEKIRFSRRSSTIVFVAIAAAVYLGTLSQLESFLALDPEPLFENPDSWLIAVGFLAYILMATGLILFAIKYDWLSGDSTWKSVFRGIWKGVALTMIWLASTAILDLMLISLVGGLVSFAISPITAGMLVIWWYSSDHWIPLNMVASLLAMFVILWVGVQVAVGPVLLLFGLLAVYDAFAVYYTGHMVALAKGVRDLPMPMPMLFELPLEDDDRSEAVADGGSPVAMLGLGDVVIPGLLIVSSIVFVSAPTVVGPITLPALGAIVGAAVGLATVFLAFSDDRAHAGLPPLFVATVGGYLLGAWVAGVPIDVAVGLESAEAIPIGTGETDGAIPLEV